MEMKTRETIGYNGARCGHRIAGRGAWHIMLICLASLLMCACHQKELVYPASSMFDVTVLFDWTYAPDAAPEGMSVVFFPIGGEGRIWRYELSGRDGGTVSLPAGSYRMLAFNNDTKYISYDGISHFDTYNAYTFKSAVSWPQSVLETYPELDDYIAYHSPDALYCGTAEDVSVSLCSVSYRPCDPGADPSDVQIKECGKHIIRCYPSPRTSKYTCIFRNVVNASGMKRGYCLLSGLAPSDLIAEDILSDAEGAYAFLAGRRDSDISGSAMAFGASASPMACQYLYLVAVLSDGKVVAFRYDVSDQILNSIDKRNVMIIIDGVELPEADPTNPDDSPTDFEVAVDDWEMVIINHVVG